MAGELSGAGLISDSGGVALLTSCVSGIAINLASFLGRPQLLVFVEVSRGVLGGSIPKF
jgi:hypothetical protein